MRPDLSRKSLPEQRPNAGDAKAESQEALESDSREINVQGR